MANIVIFKANVTINDSYYVNMLVDDHYVAYKILQDNFN